MNRRECHRCGDKLDGRVKVKRFGEYDARTQNFDHTGGVIEHWYCDDCWQDHEAREPAAVFHPHSAEQLRAILDAADGALVADFVHYFVGSRPCVRVVNGELEGATVRPEFDEQETPHGVRISVRFTAEPFDIGDGWIEDALGQRHELPESMPVLLKPVDETPFAALEEVLA